MTHPVSCKLVICALVAVIGHSLDAAATGAETSADATSPNGRNKIHLEATADGMVFSVRRDDQLVIGPSRCGLQITNHVAAEAKPRIVSVDHKSFDHSFTLAWGKTDRVRDAGELATIAGELSPSLSFRVELQARDDGVAFRTHLVTSDRERPLEVQDEATQFAIQGAPRVLYNTLDSFTTSHESLYAMRALGDVPVNRLMDCPLLLEWPTGGAAAITEAKVRDFAGMYLRRESAESTTLQCRLAPRLDDSRVAVKSTESIVTPWRVILLGDSAGALLESNLLLCLNDDPSERFEWVKPGKTTFHWWNGEFEDDFRLGTQERDTFVARHRAYIDFCARHGIAYHGLSGDGRAWYQQSSTDYGMPSADANVLMPRPELDLPAIFAYAREKNVGIRLWVHWQPLSWKLEEAFALYESWGVAGLMVDFLDRDDQEMIEFTERMLKSAARHRLHLQIHGSSKFSGEQRTFPHLLNREGVLNLEYTKWSRFCTPEHDVNVAYTRALAGPVDYHLGGFRSISRARFQPIVVAPYVMGTRCHHLALYVVYENPMPMIADTPQAYENQPGFDFLREVPTTWDETRFLVGQVGEYVVLARRKGTQWFLGGITNWNSRSITIPLNFLTPQPHNIVLYTDGSLDEEQPTAVNRRSLQLKSEPTLPIDLAPGGGFVAIIAPDARE